MKIAFTPQDRSISVGVTLNVARIQETFVDVMAFSDGGWK
jgi:hypothetical protein